MNFQMFKLDLEKPEEPEVKLPTAAGSYKKQGNSRTSTSASLSMLKPLCGSPQTVENSSRDGNTRPLICLLKNLYVGQEATIQTRHGMTSSKLGKVYVKAVYCHPAYLTYMQRTSCKMPAA